MQTQQPAFVYTFTYDAVTKKAFITSNAPATEVFAVEHQPGGISFVEVTSGGSVQVTAVSIDKRSSHSRSTLMGEQLLPTQYYGSCVTR